MVHELPVSALPAIANLIACWDFAEPAGQAREARHGLGRFPLGEAAGAIPRAVGGPLSGYAAVFDGQQHYLTLPAALRGRLNCAGPGAQVTVVAWLRRERFQHAFIAGIWQEDDHDPRRQYGLFVHLPLYGGRDNVCGHVSRFGGASPGLPYSRDYAANLTPVPLGQWVMASFTYDGCEVRAYLNEQFEPRPSYTEPGPPQGQGLSYAKNPYAWPHGLGDHQGDFTVGAVRLTRGMANHFAGHLGGLAVFDRALVASEISTLYRAFPLA